MSKMTRVMIDVGDSEPREIIACEECLNNYIDSGGKNVEEFLEVANKMFSMITPYGIRIACVVHPSYADIKVDMQHNNVFTGRFEI